MGASADKAEEGEPDSEQDEEWTCGPQAVGATHGEDLDT
jgi:hypothetical protein